MATGDIKNNLKILSTEIRSIKTPANIVNLDGMLTGDVDVYLPIYNYVFQWYSSKVASVILQKDLKLPPYDHDKTKFIETMYRILREIFQWRPPLISAQFLTAGFAEKKIIMCADIIKLVKEYNNSLQKGAGHTAALKPRTPKTPTKPASTRPHTQQHASENYHDKTPTSPAPSSKAVLSGKIDALLLHLTEVQNSVKALKEQMLLVMNQTESMLDKVLPVVTEIVDELNRREECAKQKTTSQMERPEMAQGDTCEAVAPAHEEGADRKEVAQATTKELLLEN